MKPCSLYPGRIGSHGYGVLPNGVLAHRQAYADAHGVPLSDIKDLTVRHSCDVRACREPAHLTTGTHLDNMRDMRERGPLESRERHGSAKLTRAQVNNARREHVPGSRTHGAARTGCTIRYQPHANAAHFEGSEMANRNKKPQSLSAPDGVEFSHDEIPRCETHEKSGEPINRQMAFYSSVVRETSEATKARIKTYITKPR